jgi:hypothetical protein
MRFNKAALFRLLSVIVLASSVAGLSCTDPGTTDYDVVVIGAGMAGLFAGKTLREGDPNLDFVILESQDRVGGRVHSTKIGTYTVEEGANWFSDVPGNSALDLANEYGIDMTLQDFFDFFKSTYEYDHNVKVSVRKKESYLDTKQKQYSHFACAIIQEPSDTGYAAVHVSSKALDRSIKAFKPVFQCLHNEGNKFYLPNGRPGSDDLVEALQDQCGWNNATNLDFLAKWINIDYEFAENTTNMLSFPFRRFDIGPFYFVTEQEGGLESSLAMRFAKDTFGKQLDAIQFSKRVSKITYNLDPMTNGGYSALIEANQVNGCPMDQYRAKRVVLTTSVGVIASEDIEFIPTLEYENPLVMKDYIKIFYQFEEKFWDDAQFIVSLQKEGNIGKCHHWQNLDFTSKPQSNARSKAKSKAKGGARKQTSTEFLPGSGILFCTLLTEVVKELGGKLTDSLVEGELLEPLRRVYGDLVDAPNLLGYKYHKWNEDQNFYGSYSNWQPGYNLTDYFKFYGGIFDSSEKFIEPCGHNGCNRLSDNKWILHISGTASCIEDWELVKGAIASGERSGHYVLNDIGCGGNGCGIEFESPCEDFFSNAYRKW